MLILSGYNDFEYARTAIRYGVKEYLLKPVAAEELERALSECIQAIHFEEQTRHTLKHYEHFHLCSMLANIRDGVLSYSDLCVQHPEFENLAYSIYCSVYVSEHTHDAVLQLVDRLRGQDFSLRIYAGKRIHLHAADFPLRQRKTTPYRKLFYGFYCTAKRIYIFVY